MSLSSLVPCIAILLLQPWGAHTFPPTPGVCPTPCLCQKTPLLNCSSSGLSEAPSHIPATATALDLSHNAISSLVPLGHLRLRGLLRFWVGGNALKSLSMCLRKGLEGTKTLRRRHECVPWAPDLQLLSAERNQLKRLPRGLGSIKSLQVLQFAHNQISELGFADLAGCTHLTEVHLQHNLIKTIHPQAFKDLPNLQVLDLSYNLLTIIPLPAYLSLRNLNALVSVTGNRWRCDCNFKIIRRWLSFDNELGNPTWNLDCFSPVHHAGKDLLYLEQSDLTCPPPEYSTPGLLKEVTVEEGGELLLSCTADSQGLTQTRWWTPQGHFSENQQVLLISNITEQHAGHYACISGVQEQELYIFNLHVRKRVYETRQRREVQNLNIERNVRAVQQSQFVLAVCLSVFITFIVAFVLGVVLRPLLDKLWQRIRNKRKSTPSSTNSRTSSTQPRPYVNEGYSDTGEHVQEVRVGSRVTFGGVTEVNDNGGNIPYYVTVEDAKSDSSSESNLDVEVSYENTKGSESVTNSFITHVELEDFRDKESSIPSSSIQMCKEVPLREENSKTSVQTSKDMEFEPIPDPVDSAELEERKLSSVSSESGLPQEHQSLHEGIESEEQSVDPPTVTTLDDEDGYTDYKEVAIPGHTTDPFSGTLSDVNEENVDNLDRDFWNDSGESFSFPDESPRSSSRIIQSAVVDFSLFEGEQSVDKQPSKLGSCNSSQSGLSEGEQTEYTVNLEEYEESDTYDDLNSGNDTITPDPYDILRHQGDRDSFIEEPFTDQSEFSDYSNGNFYGEEPKEYYVHPVYRTGQKSTSVSRIEEAGASSSSDDEETQTKNEDYPRKLEIKLESEATSEGVIPIQNLGSTININFDNSSSCTDIEETCKEAVQPSEQTYFEKIGLAFDQLPKVKKSLLFSVSDPQHPTQYGSTSTLKAGCDSVTSQLNSSFEESFLGKLDVTLYPVPTVKRYLQFSHSEPRPSVPFASKSLKAEEITPVKGTKTWPEDRFSPTTQDNSFFVQIGASIDKVPKVERHIQFSETEPQPSVLSPSTSLKAEEIIPVLGSNTLSKRPDSASEAEDTFFGLIGVSVDKVPKVKRYIQFKPSEAQPSSPSTFLNTETITPNLAPKAQSGFQDTQSPTTNKDNFFEQIDTSLDGVPKIHRYIQFTQSQPEVHPGASSEKKFCPTTKGDGFFGQIEASIDGVPKVKRYIRFSQTGPQRSTLTPSPSLMTEKVTPVIGPHTQTVKPLTASPDEVSFFEQIGASIDEVPKVKGYIQFKPSESQPSFPSAPLNTGTTTPILVTKPHSGFQDNHSLKTKEENFFEQIDTSLDGVPKIQRYIQFTQSEVEPSAQSLSTALPNPERISPTFVTTVQSEKGLSQGDVLLGDIGTSFVPKVKRYIQFTQSQHQASTLTPSTSLKTETITPVLGTTTQSKRSDSSSAEGDSFIGNTAASTDGVPKVKRYIQFTPFEPQPSALTPSTSLKTEKITPVIDPKTQSIRPDSSPAEGDSFVGHAGASVDGLPKVKRYIQFSHSESQSSDLTPSTSLKKEQITPVLGTTTQSLTHDSSSEGALIPTTTEDNFFRETGTPFNGVPKVKRYIKFSSRPQQSTFLNTETISPQSVPKTQSASPDSSSVVGDTFFGQIGKPFDGVPKVKQYIHFSHSEPQITTSQREEISPDCSSDDEVFFRANYAFIDEVPKVKRYHQFTPSETQASTSSTYVRSETIIPNLVPQTQSMKPEGDDSFFGRINASIDGVPQVKRYIQFSHLEPQTSTLFPSTSVKTEKIKPILGNIAQSTKLDSSSEDGNSLFGANRASFDGVPKVKRYIQFNQLEAQRLSPSINTETTNLNKHSPNKKEENFFEQTDASIAEVPKIQRYIQFSQSEVQPIAQYPSTELNSERISPKLVTHLGTGASSKDGFKPTADEHNVFGPIDASPDGIPKVKKYIHFTHSASQQSAQPPTQNFDRITSTPLTKTELPDNIKTINKDNFFVKTDTSLYEIPKVKRYIQFTECESSPSGISSDDEVMPSSDKHSFLGGISVPLADIPKIQRSLHFTQSKPNTDMTVATETSVLDQLSRPKRTLFFSNSDPYDQFSTSPQDRLSERISHSQFDDDDSNAQDSSPASSQKGDAREYLRDSSQARQKQERRRLMFTQKRRAMDGFKLTTHSYTVQRTLNQNEETFPVYKRNIFHGVSTGITTTASHKDVNAAEPESLSAKSISPLKYKYHNDV